MTENFRIQLKSELDRRKKRNPRYSLRAYARFLNVDVATLSRVLAGKGGLSAKLAVQIADVLNFDPTNRREFLSSVAKSYAPEQFDSVPVRPVPRQVRQIEDKIFESLSKLSNIALYELVRTKDFAASVDWIANRLLLPKAKAEEALKVLMAANLVTVNESKKLGQTGALSAARADITTPAMRHLQREIREAALHSLDHDPFETRVMSGMTMAINPYLVPQARSIISKFMNELSILLETPELTEVYQLEVSLFPLSHRKSVDESV